MKKLLLSLVALLSTVGAWAEGVATVDAIKNGYIYTIKSARNAITWDGTSSNCVGATLDATNVNHQFVAIKLDGTTDQFYLYNVGANKFMGQSGTNASLTDFNEVYWKIKASGDETWPLMIDAPQSGDHFNFNGEKVIEVSWWADADEGNKLQIAEISAADETLLTTINAQIEKGNTVIAAQSVVDNASDTRVGAYTTASVSQLSAALTAFNGNKTETNFSTLESAYNTFMASTPSVVTLADGEKFRVQCYDTGRGYMAYSTVEGKGSETKVVLAGAANWDAFPALDAEGVYADWAMITVNGGQYIYNVQKKQCITYGSVVTFSDAGTPVIYSAYEGTPTVFEIKFEGGGNTRLSFSPGWGIDAGVQTYSGNDDGTKFYIEKVGESVDELISAEMEEKIFNTVVDKFNALKNAEKFDILEGSVVCGPSEFANPAQLNDDIDAANAVADNYEAKKTFVNSEAGQRIQKYLDEKATYGALANIQFEMKDEYGTLILPCPSSAITGLKRSTCSAVESGVLTLDLQEGNFTALTPYVIQAEAGTKFTIIGWDKNTDEPAITKTVGLLTGVLNESSTVPAGSYILSKKDDKLGFYRVSEGTTYNASQYKCYLTLPAAEARYNALFFDGTATGINNVNGSKATQNNGVIYNMAGQRINRLQKGLNIVNGKIILK